MKHTPRKRFGQNFLNDQTVIEAIVSAISPRATDAIVEIGPGLGALTRLLLQYLPHLDVIELDRDLVARLLQIYAEQKLSIHQGDVLQFDFATLHRQPDQKLRIVGNLPYNISTPLLFHLIQFRDIVHDQHFMLQKEVVERMVAEPGSRVYGRLSVMLQWQYHMDLLFTVPPQAFTPAPKVDSAIVRMIPKKAPEACDFSQLEKVVATAFSQRRKVIRNSLASLFTENELIENGIDPGKRPEETAVDAYIRLANSR